MTLLIIGLIAAAFLAAGLWGYHVATRPGTGAHVVDPLAVELLRYEIPPPDQIEARLTPFPPFDQAPASFDAGPVTLTNCSFADHGPDCHGVTAGLASTGELRALAYAGDLDSIHRDNEAFEQMVNDIYERKI